MGSIFIFNFSSEDKEMKMNMQLFKELVRWRSPKMEPGDHFSDCGRSNEMMSIGSSKKTFYSNLCSNTIFYIKEEKHFSMWTHAVLTIRLLCLGCTPHKKGAL